MPRASPSAAIPGIRRFPAPPGEMHGGGRIIRLIKEKANIINQMINMIKMVFRIISLSMHASKVLDPPGPDIA
jgi:hypothetical protein